MPWKLHGAPRTQSRLRVKKIKGRGKEAERILVTLWSFKPVSKKQAFL